MMALSRLLTASVGWSTIIWGTGTKMVANRTISTTQEYWAELTLPATNEYVDKLGWIDSPLPFSLKVADIARDWVLQLPHTSNVADTGSKVYQALKWPYSHSQSVRIGYGSGLIMPTCDDPPQSQRHHLAELLTEDGLSDVEAAAVLDVVSAKSKNMAMRELVLDARMIANLWDENPDDLMELQKRLHSTRTDAEHAAWLNKYLSNVLSASQRQYPMTQFGYDALKAHQRIIQQYLNVRR